MLCTSSLHVAGDGTRANNRKVYALQHHDRRPLRRQPIASMAQHMPSTNEQNIGKTGMLATWCAVRHQNEGLTLMPLKPSTAEKTRVTRGSSALMPCPQAAPKAACFVAGASK